MGWAGRSAGMGRLSQEHRVWTEIGCGLFCLILLDHMVSRGNQNCDCAPAPTGWPDWHK